jgi:hypothetical protein
MSRRFRHADRYTAKGTRSLRESGMPLHYQARHGERLDAAIADKLVVEEWCRQNGCTLEIRNDGHHWMVRGAVWADWWPSSAKLVIERRWRRWCHTHTVQQAVQELSRYPMEMRKWRK